MKLQGEAEAAVAAAEAAKAEGKEEEAKQLTEKADVRACVFVYMWGAICFVSLSRPRRTSPQRPTPPKSKPPCPQ